MQRILLAVVLLGSTTVKGSEIHVMEKGDTLWSLAERYYQNPYDWFAITELDGTPVPDVYRIPIGHKVLIYPDVAQEKNESKKLDIEVVELKQEKKQPVKIIQKPKANTKRDPSHYIFLTKTTGLIRFNIDGEYALVPVDYIINRFKKNRLNIVETVLKDGVYIEKDLIRQILFNSRGK